MNICPYCRSPIEFHWSYCRNCDKPLLSNLEGVIDRIDRSSYNGSEAYHLDLEEEHDYFDETEIVDEEIDQKLKDIDQSLKSKEILGDPIPGSLLLEKSSLYYKKRDLSKALKNLELALKNFTEENDLLNIAICHNELGIIHEDDGYFDQAIYHFNRSLEILKDLNDKNKEIMVLNNLGNLHFIIKDLEQSYNYYQEAFQLSQQENLLFEEIQSSSNLVEVLFLLHDYDRIKKILARNVEFFKENEDIYGIIQTYIKYGKLYYNIGEDYNESVRNFTNAFELINRLEKSISIYIRAKLEWESFLYLGKINFLWDNNTKAESFFLQSLEAVRIFEIKENIKEGEILENLAELYLSKGEIEKSIEYYNLSCEIYYKFGDNRKIADLKFKIAKVYLEFEENTLKATNLFEEALEIYEDLAYIKECAIIFHKLGDLNLQEGIIELALSNFESAKNYYEKFQDDYNKNLLEEKIKSLKTQDGYFS